MIGENKGESLKKLNSQISNEQAKAGGAKIDSNTSGPKKLKSVVRNGVSLLQNPYVAWISLELFNPDLPETILLPQNKVVVSAEIEVYFDPTTTNSATVTLFDFTGGYELEKLLLKYNHFRLQYGFQEGSVSEVQTYISTVFTPSLQDGYSQVILKGVSVAEAMNRSSDKTITYGADEKKVIRARELAKEQGYNLERFDPSNVNIEAGERFPEYLYQGTKISDIAKEVIIGEGWQIGEVEETLPITDSRGMPRKFNRVGMKALDFLRYELAPYAISAKTGAGGYIAIIDETTDVSTGEVRVAVSFKPLIHKLASKSNNPDLIATYDIRTPSGASLTKVIDFRPEINNQYAGANEQVEVIGSTESGVGVSSITKAEESKGAKDGKALERLETMTKVQSSLSSSEAKAQTQASIDYSFVQTFRAELTILGDPSLKVTDLVEVNYIMQDGSLHHSSGEYIILGVNHHISAGEFLTSLKLGRGTNAEVYRSSANDPLSGGEIYTGGVVYEAPKNGYKLSMSKAAGIQDNVKLQRATYMLNWLVMNGIQPMGAAYMIGSWNQESGLSPGVITPLDQAKNGWKDTRSCGLQQWSADRLYGMGKKATILSRERTTGKSNGGYDTSSAPEWYGNNAPASLFPNWQDKVSRHSPLADTPAGVQLQLKYFIAEITYHPTFKRLRIKEGLNSNNRALILKAIKQYTGYGIEGARYSYGDAIWAMIKSQSVIKESIQLGAPRSAGKGGLTTTGVVTGEAIRFETSLDSSAIRHKHIKKVVSIRKQALSHPTDPQYRKISSGFGRRNIPAGYGNANHTGIDIGGGGVSSPIYAMHSGVVTEVGFSPYGRRVKISDGAGLETIYLHLASYSVQVGQRVVAGAKIGMMGGSGLSEGKRSETRYAIHLHLTMKVGGVIVNPEAIFIALGYSGESRHLEGYRVL